MSILGFLLSRFINIEASEQFAHALENHPSRVTVFVPHYAMSGGTMIALAADEIILDENAVLGPVDPQLGEYPAASILKAVELKSKDEIDDKTLILADIAKKAMVQVSEFVLNLLKNKVGTNSRDPDSGQVDPKLPYYLLSSQRTGTSGAYRAAPEIYDLMELYPQPAQRRPSVQYIPVPYFSEKQNKK
ncbi:MAG: SDH family Clp fold serine proteinase [Eubacteriales bacterium]